MPDPFDLLGTSNVARASRLQRAHRRRAAASQAESGAIRRACAETSPRTTVAPRCAADVAVDFVAMTEIVARMQASFFGPHR